MNRLRLTCSIALVGISMVAYGGAYCWLFDLLTPFRPQYVVIAAFGFALSGLVRERSAALAFGFCLVLNLVEVGPFLRWRDPAPNMANQIAIASFNTWRRNRDWPAVEAVVQELDADLILFQETPSAIQKGAASLDRTYQVYSLPPSLALLRRGAPLRVASPAKPVPGVPEAVQIGLKFDGRPLRILSLHLAPPTTPRYARARRSALSAVSAWLRRGSSPAVVIGDFNAPPWGREIRSLQGAAGLYNSQVGFGLQPTWPYHRPRALTLPLRIPIDHCLHTGDLVTLESSRGPAGPSNHRPIVARIAWRAD